MLFKVVVLVCGLMAFANSVVSRIVSVYNALEARSIETDVWRSRTNENGSAAWNTSYLLDSYIEMYETTHDRRYLDRFATIADALTNNTDAARGIQDYTGKARVGWGNTSYSPDHSRVVFLAHSAMIADPLARFAYVVNQSGSVPDLSRRAKNYQALAEAALHEFDEHWRYNRDTGVGFYIFPTGHPLGLSKKNEVEVPFNMELEAGRLLINLWKVTGNTSYKQNAATLATNFKKYLKVDDSGAYTWGYSTASYANRNKPPEPEDVSHGAEDVRFAVLAAQNGIVFTRDDLDRFAKAYFRYRSNVTKPAQRDALDRWVFLAWESCSVYQASYPDLISRTGRQDAEVLLALAGLARYADRCGT